MESIKQSEARSVSFLYGGEIRVEFHPGTHRYYIFDKDIEVTPRAPSVTTVCGIIDKPWLVPWAANSAVALCAGAIQPNQEHSEIFLETVWAQARKGYRTIKQAAADVGTEVHTFLEKYIRDPSHIENIPPEDTQAGRSIRAAIKWLESNQIEPLEVERRIFSRKHRFTGTLDKRAKVNGIHTILDWKTSKGLYPEFLLQTAAYQGAYEEETSDRIEQRILVRLDKETGDFHPHVLRRGEFRKDYSAFLAALKLFKRVRQTQ